MEQTWICTSCWEENVTWLQREEGDHQEFVEDCSVCCRSNVIVARFNALTNDFDLEIYQEDVG
jgi:hypothetical protein